MFLLRGEHLLVSATLVPWRSSHRNAARLICVAVYEVNELEETRDRYPGTSSS